MDKLTKEEVLRVANLARIEVTEEEIENYQVKLKQLMDQVDEINDIKDEDEDYLIAPWQNDTILRDDEISEMLDAKEVLKNVPEKSGNYIKVPVVINND